MLQADKMASILIKLLIDMWLAGDVHETFALTLSMLQAALRQPDTTYRTRVYDLIYNLSLHAHMIETEEGAGGPAGGPIEADLCHADSGSKRLSGEALLQDMGYYRSQLNGSRFVLPLAQQVRVSGLRWPWFALAAVLSRAGCMIETMPHSMGKKT